MWLQIILSIILAAAALQFIIYAARHELVPVLSDRQNFTVHNPRVVLWTSIVLFALAGSFVLSMLIWHEWHPAGIAATGCLLAAGLYAWLLARVWRIEVKSGYLVCVSAFGVKRLVHYEDIKRATVSPARIVLDTPVKTFKMSAHVVYGEDLLTQLADHHVPIFRE